jgi:membrane protease YdiL (CAAX protease family)
MPSRDTLRAAVPIALTVIAALVPVTRPFVLVALLTGTAVAVRRHAEVRWTWAAPIPIALSLCWALVPASAADAGGLDCTSPVSPPALWRLAEAVLVLGMAAVLAAGLGASRASLWIRRPARRVVRLAVLGFVVLAPLGLVLGAFLAGPFFGSFALDLGRPAALLPALVFAGSNALMEEIAYRGILVAWWGRLVGLWPAVVLQAIVFGLAHTGPDFVGSPLPVVLAMIAGGLIAGVIAIRTRSLLLPIAIHAALDLPLYWYLACRSA